MGDKLLAVGEKRHIYSLSNIKNNQPKRTAMKPQTSNISDVQNTWNVFCERIGGITTIYNIMKYFVADCNEGNTDGYKYMRLVCNGMREIADSNKILLKLNFKSKLIDKIPRSVYYVSPNDDSDVSAPVDAARLNITIDEHNIVKKCVNAGNNGAIFYYASFLFHNSRVEPTKIGGSNKFKAALYFHKYFRNGGKSGMIPKTDIIILGTKVFNSEQLQTIFGDVLSDISNKENTGEYDSGYLILVYIHMEKCSHLRLYIAKIYGSLSGDENNGPHYVQITKQTNILDYKQLLPMHFTLHNYVAWKRIACCMRLCKRGNYKCISDISEGEVAWRIKTLAFHSIIDIIKQSLILVNTSLSKSILHKLCEGQNTEVQLCTNNSTILEDMQRDCKSARSYENDEFSISLAGDYSGIITILRSIFGDA